MNRRVPSWLWIPLWSIAFALLAVSCVTAIGCAGGPSLLQRHRVGTDDDAYLAMRHEHRVRCCPTAKDEEVCVYSQNPACTNEVTVLEEYRKAIQAYFDAAQLPGNPARQKARLDVARTAAMTLFPEVPPPPTSSELQ